jgi:hypothetical protein
MATKRKQRPLLKPKRKTGPPQYGNSRWAKRLPWPAWYFNQELRQTSPVASAGRL